MQFYNPEIPLLPAAQSRDFWIGKTPGIPGFPGLHSWARLLSSTPCCKIIWWWAVVDRPHRVQLGLLNEGSSRRSSPDHAPNVTENAGQDNDIHAHNAMTSVSSVSDAISVRVWLKVSWMWFVNLWKLWVVKLWIRKDCLDFITFDSIVDCTKIVT